MKNYDKNRESSYLKNWDLNNLYEWVMSQKLALDNFKWVEGYFLELDVQYPENLHNLQNDLPFLSVKIKIEKVERILANLHDKTEHVIHIRNLKQTLKSGNIVNPIEDGLFQSCPRLGANRPPSLRSVSYMLQ